MTVCGYAHAQEPPSPAALVDEVEVIAKLPGPALWRVSTPTSQLWIIGLASPLPDRFDWDARRLETALSGARELVVPPGASVGVGEMIAMTLDLGHIIHLDHGQTLHAILPEPLRVRFDAAARAAGQTPEHYDHWRPVFAAMALVFDAEQKDALNPEGPQRKVAEIARRQGVRVRRLANYKAGDLIRGVSRLDAAASVSCMTLAVNKAERMPTDAARMAQAWAHGDVAEVRAVDAQTSPEACYDAAPTVAALRDRVAKDWAADLSRALEQPGKTVAAIDLDSLTRRDGLLDQLRAKGLTVIGPSY
jgi:uncharacterized protein YbaP (TraB family)